MTVSDMINLGLAIASFLLATISIVTVIITLLQNKKMIENSTRPYITVMYETITRPAELCRYIVLKNFGQTAAKITAMECTGDTNEAFLTQFENVEGLTLAPSQRLLYFYGGPNTESVDVVSFKYSYQAGRKIYHEDVTLQLIAGASVRRSGRTTPDTTSAAYALQEIVERMI